MIAPKELEHVRTALLTLLSVAPSDVLTVMADDCKGSEAETGASRRNILDFIEQQAKGFRDEVLASGNNVEAEEVFRNGFYDALANCESTEKKQILGMISTVSTISGKNATAETSAEFVRHLTESIRPNSTSSSTIPYLNLFSTFLSRNPPLDPRYLILFLASHGGTVVSLAFEKADKAAIALLDRLKLGIAEVIRGGLSNGTMDLKRVIPEFGKAILEEIIVSINFRRMT